MLVDLALEDWKAVPDADLVAVCARARLLAAKKPASQGFTAMATTSDVLEAWKRVSLEHSHQAYARRQREEADLIATGRALPAPTLASMSKEAQDAFWDDFYKNTTGLDRKNGARK